MAYLSTESEDFTARRSIAKKMIETHFRHAYEFELEIEGQPPHFAIYVKDISYGPIEIETDQIKVGGITFNMPVCTGLVTLTMNVRDDVDGTIRNWFESWCGFVYGLDGTFMLPVQYLRTARKYDTANGRRGRLVESWLVMPTQLGDIEETTEGGGSLFSFPLTVVQYRSLG